MAQTLLFEPPGPRARFRNRLLGAITVLAILAAVIFVIWRLAEADQFSDKRWELLTYPAVQLRLLGGVGATLLGFALGGLGAIVFSFLIAVGRRSIRAWVRVPVSWFTDLFRASPVLLTMMLIYYGLPSIGVDGVTPLLAVVIGLTLYNGSVMAEILRAGIDSLPRGQSEAGLAIGLRRGQLLRLILLPQAVRNMMPALVSQLVVVLKDTALGFIVTYHELLYLINFYGAQPRFDIPIVPMTIVGGSAYVVLCLLLAGLAQLLARRMSSSSKFRAQGTASSKS